MKLGKMLLVLIKKKSVLTKCPKLMQPENFNFCNIYQKQFK